MRISRKFLLALMILLIFNFLQIGFPQEIKEQNSPALKE
jgi:hypothetical protein